MAKEPTDPATAVDGEVCPVCGAEIPPGAPEGMCPACLLNADTMVAPPSSSKPKASAKVPGKAATDPLVEPPSPSPQAPALDPQFAVPIEKLRELFPDLEIIDLLGAGGMGAVYRARQPRLDRLVALKVLTCPPQMHDDFALRFEREAQVLARLNHPNIVTIYDFGEIDRSDDPDSHGNLFYFVMEFVDGADLNQMIRTGELTPEQALQIVPKICDALQFAHDEGITHRDIKPANILVDKKGDIRIADFGLAKLIGAESDALGTGLTMTGTSMGTPHYMAPEQWETSAVVDHRADIYSLGVVFYEMLTGERPHGVFDPPSGKVQVDVKLDDVVLKAMEKDVDRRYQQASEIKEDVTRVTTTAPKARSRKSKAESPPSESRSRAVLVSVLGIILLGGMGFWFSPLNPFAREATVTVDGDAAGNADKEGGLAVSAAGLSAPGRLRGEGTFLDGEPIDLSRVAEFDDIIDIQTSPYAWIALRANGDTISSDGRSDSKNIFRIARSYVNENDEFVLVNRQGQLEFPNAKDPPVLPDAFDEAVIVDAAVEFGHGLALTKDGRAIPWGQRYLKAVGDPADTAGTGTPRWPAPPDSALRDVAGIAVTATHAATFHHDGSLTVWGWDGLLDLESPREMDRIRKAGMHGDRLVFEDERSMIWILQLPRNPSPDQPVVGAPQFFRGGKGILGVQSFWMNESSEWMTLFRGEPRVIQESLEPDGIRGPIHFWKRTSGKFKGTNEIRGHIFWIEPKGEPVTDPLPDLTILPRGRLRALHAPMNGSTYDLSKFDAYDDFVDVAGGFTRSVALRANGETVSLDGKGDFDNISRLATSFGEQFAFIDTAGKLRFEVDREMKLSAEFDRAVLIDATIGLEHGLALTSDGRALPFGNRYRQNVRNPQESGGYGTPRWPAPSADALDNVKAIAVTATHAATLHPDGTLSLWNWEGPVELPGKLKSKTITTMASSMDGVFLLDSSDQLWRLPLKRNPTANQPVADDGKLIPVGVPASALNGEAHLGHDGKWHSHKSHLQALIDQASLQPDSAFSLNEITGKSAAVGGLLWIEPKKEPATSPSPFPLARPTRPGDPGPVTLISLKPGADTSDHPLADIPEGLDDVVAVDVTGFNDNPTSASHALALNADGRVTIWGPGVNDTLKVPADLDPAVAIAAFAGTPAGGHAAALHEDGTVTVWGGWKDLTETSTTWRDVVAIASGGARPRLYGLTADGRILYAAGQLDTGGIPPDDIQGHVIQISAQGNATAALLDDGTVRGWGAMPSVDAESLSSARDVEKVITLKHRVFTLDADGRLMAHADKSDNYYPPERILTLSGITRVLSTESDVVLDNIFAAFSSADERWHAWGDTNWKGADEVEKILADAGLPPRIAFADPRTILAITHPSQESASPFPLPRPARPEAAGKVIAWHHTEGLNAEPTDLAVLPEGLDDVVAIDVGFGYGGAKGPNGKEQHALALHADGKVSAWGRDVADETKVPPNLTPAIAIAAGQRHSVALHEDGTVSAWGWGKTSGFQSRIADWTDVVAIASGAEHLLALTSHGQVLASCPNNQDGNLDVPEEIQGRTVAISAGTRLSLALLDDGTVRMWGKTDGEYLDVDSLSAARKVKGITSLKDRPFTLDQRGRLTAHFSPSDEAYPPKAILALENITHLTFEKKSPPLFAARTAADQRWHIWENAQFWNLERIPEELATLGPLIDLEFAHPDFLIAIRPKQR